MRFGIFFKIAFSIYHISTVSEILPITWHKVIGNWKKKYYQTIYGLIIHSQYINLALLKFYALLNKNCFCDCLQFKTCHKIWICNLSFQWSLTTQLIFKKVHISFNESTLIKLLFHFLFLLSVWYEWTKVTCVCLVTFYEPIKGQYNTFTIRLLCTNGSMSKAITINSHGLIKVK